MNIEKNLVKAIVDLAIFLEFSPEDLLDADAAIVAMETLSFNLQQMQHDTKLQFQSTLLQLAMTYDIEEHRMFVEDMADNFGV